MRIAAIYYSEALTDYLQANWRHLPGDDNIYSYHHKNIGFYIFSDFI